MNCKPGDLAFIVRSVNGNEGRIVEVCEEMVPSPLDGALCWGVKAERPLRGSCVQGGPQLEACSIFVPDFCLRPIRGEPDRAVDGIRELAPHELEGVAIWP